MKTFKIPFTKGAKGMLWLPSEGVQLMTQELGAKVYHGRNGKVEDLGVICRKLVTTEGVNYIRNALAGALTGGVSAEIDVPLFAIGGATAQTEAITDTFAAKVDTDAVPIADLAGSPYNNVYGEDSEHMATFVVPTLTTGTKTLILESNFDFHASAATSVTENFFCFTTGAGLVAILFDRSVFTAIGVTATDKIKFTYTLTFTDGG